MRSFVYKGQVLNALLRLADYGIEEDATVYYCAIPRPAESPHMSAAPAEDDFFSNPLIDSVTSNSDLLMMIMESNPTIQALRQRSPELNALLSDPQTLQDAFQAMRNPAMMRELMRTSDRALSNIDAVPGGFDALRQVYRDVQEPVWESVTAANELEAARGPAANTYAVRSPAPADEPFPQAWQGEDGRGDSPETAPFQRPMMPGLFAPPILMQPQIPAARKCFRMMTCFMSSLPLERFRSQLSALQSMGFTDEGQCLQALERHGGNLNQAIDDLLQEGV